MSGARRLIDMRMHDGSRHFAGFRERGLLEPDWDLLRAAIPRLVGAVETGFVTDRVTEAWLDFTFAGHEFSLNNQHGEWWCFVKDAAAPANTRFATNPKHVASLGSC